MYADGLGDVQLVQHPSGLVWIVNGRYFRRFIGNAECDYCKSSPFRDGNHEACYQHSRLHCLCMFSN
jgi:hypothetical protein